MARSDGYFKKGQSGNPGGRPKAAPGFREACRELSTKALKALEEVLKDKSAGARQARVAAAKTVIEHAWGRATQVVENIEGAKSYEADQVLEDLFKRNLGIDISKAKDKIEKPVH